MKCIKNCNSSWESTVWFSVEFFTSSGLAMHNWNEKLKITLANTKTVYEIAKHFILCMVWLPFKCTLIIFIRRMLIMMVMMMQKNANTYSETDRVTVSVTVTFNCCWFVQSEQVFFRSFFLLWFWFWLEHSENLFAVRLESNYWTGFSQAAANQRTIT